MRGGLPGITVTDALMTVGWRPGPEGGMQKARVCVRAWAFQNALRLSLEGG
jgi:hypothetical protein